MKPIQDHCEHAPAGCCTFCYRELQAEVERLTTDTGGIVDKHDAPQAIHTRSMLRVMGHPAEAAEEVEIRLEAPEDTFRCECGNPNFIRSEKSARCSYCDKQNYDLLVEAGYI